MKNNFGDQARIHHILDAIFEVENFTNQISQEEFIQNTMIHSACIRQLEIIGEASNKLTEDFKNKNNEIDWSNIIGLRNILIHDYFGVDLLVVWEIIKNDIPKLKEKIQSILK